MQMTEFCGISFQNLAAVELLYPEPNRGDRVGACMHTAPLQEQRLSERKKRAFQNYHTLLTGCYLICQKLNRVSPRKSSDSDKTLLVD